MSTVPASLTKARTGELRLRKIVTDVLAAPDVNNALRRRFAMLDAEGHPGLICAVFEALIWRIDVTDHAIFSTAAQAYRAMERRDAAFLIASAAQRVSPGPEGAAAMYRILFEYFRSRQRQRDANEVISQHHQVLPGVPADYIEEITSPLADGEESGHSNGAEGAESHGGLADMAAAILAAAHPEDLLLQSMATLDTGNQQALACDLFESVGWRIKIRNCWTCQRVSHCYQLLGRVDAAFLTAAMADRMGQKYSGAYLTGRIMFYYFKSSARPRDALDVFFEHADRFPNKPLAVLWEIMPLLAAVGIPVSEVAGHGNLTSDETLRRNIVVVPEEISPGWSCDIHGKQPVSWLAPFATDIKRPAIEIACVSNGELLIDSDTFAVYDARGEAFADLSLHDYPPFLRKHLDSLALSDGMVEQIELDDAIVISDKFAGTPNLCHFLLDQMTRFELYRRAGVNVGDATVIGGEPKAGFQKLALPRFGVRQYLHTGRVARVRAKRLWISTNCRAVRHPANFGAEWAIDFLRSTLTPKQPGGCRRLYISRSDAAGRRVINEAEVVALLKQHHFEIIVPGLLPFDDQVAAFSQASHVVGPHGAGLTNIVVSPVGCHVLEIFHPLYGTISYAALAPAVGLKYSALIGKDGHSDAPEFNDPSKVDQSQSRMGSRDIRVSIDDLTKWLNKVCPT